MSTVTLQRGLVSAAAEAQAQLAQAAPHLVDRYRAALPHAADVVGRRLRGALHREDIGGSRDRLTGRGRCHGFDRFEFEEAGAADPTALLPASIVDRDGGGLAEELTNAVVNLAVAYARRATDDATLSARARLAGTHDVVGALAGAAPDEQALALERLGTDGHNLHPCGRTRLGWQVPDLLEHDLETGRTSVDLVAVRRDWLVGDDIGAALARAYPRLPAVPPDYALHPVHAWQLASVVRHRYADLVRAGVLRPLPVSLPAAPTAALRTLLLPPGVDGQRRYLKLSLDIQVTSTRRSISVPSTRNGPAISALLERLFADCDGERVLLLTETAGAAVPVDAGRDRDLAAIVRTGLEGRLAPGEFAVPGGALPARSPVTGRSVLAEIVDRYAVTRARPADGATALAFLDEYARLLLPPVLRMTTRYGVALEAHLQNCLPTFVGGVPHRLVLRDFAGLRLHLPRLAVAGLHLDLWPGSVVATEDETVLRAKAGYTALQAHLGEVVVLLVHSHGLDEAAAWQRVRAVVDEVYDTLRADPRRAAQAAADQAFFTAPRVPHKALVRMRLGGEGDLYVPVRNPLHDF